MSSALTIGIACAAAILAATLGALGMLLAVRRRAAVQATRSVGGTSETAPPQPAAPAAPTASTRGNGHAADDEHLRAERAEIDRRSAAVEASRTALATAERVRNLMISKLSHEVRTPLNSIITLSQLLGDGTTGPLAPDQHRYIEVIHRSGTTLLGLINDVLDVAHIESGRMDLQMGTVDVRPLIRGVGAAGEERARSKGLPLHMNPPRVPTLAHADEDRLRQVLAALVDHAIQETTNGYIELSSDSDDRWVIIRVSDTGAGSSPELRHAEFDVFLAQPADRPPGPGLILAGKLTQLMGGTLVVDSAPGEGTTFSLSLPRSTDGSAAQRTSEAVVTRAPISPAHVLLIEDDELERLRVADILQNAGYRVSVASSGQDGLNNLREGHFDAVVLDLVMPGMTGLDVLRAARADEHLSSVPFVVLSALYMTRSEREVLGPTVAGVVRKGEGTGDELTMHLARALASRTAAGPPPPSMPAHPLARVLVIEDDDDNLFAIEQVLASLPVTIETATTGRDAIEICRRRAPNLILMDVELPGVSGADVSGDIRRLPDCADIPIIALTATAERGPRSQVPEGRCDAYLSKPVKPGDVVNAVTRALQLGIH
jgi:signal transduction histidine kinase/DNA-binding response OmpR family regulator